MLATLIIKHFTIVDELNLDFEQGMTVFTGETGAGKSIMLDALLLLLGQRADPSVVREGADNCEITASFLLNNNPVALAWLAHHEQPDTQEIILRRIISRSGRSKAFINGVLFPLQKIRELGDLLLHIHGQNEQYHLLKPEVHREQLDAFALNNHLLAEINRSYQSLRKTEEQIAAIEKKLAHSDQKALLQYQVEELESLELVEGELEQLGKEHKLLSEAHHLIEGSEHLRQLLEEDDSLLTKLVQLHDGAQDLDIDHPSLANFLELTSSALIQLQEAATELHTFQSSLVLDPERLQEVEKRLGDLYDLARKHRVKAEELITHYQQLQQDLDRFHHYEQELIQLKKHLQTLNEQYWLQAHQLRKRRQQEALVLGQEITGLIKTLGMPNGEVTVEVSPLDKATPFGSDKVEYIVTLNPGSKPHPLAKIASGGELSRLSLAIQVLTAEKKAYPTLIFDEVDTGIGGATAAKVGQLLKRLGQHTQVFCVTHQAQVAANANHHLLVQKETKHQQTYSHISALTENEKVEELARMLSGVTMTEQTLAHARALLAQAS